MSVSSHATRAAELFVEWIELPAQSRSARLLELLSTEPELGAELAALLQRFDADPAPPDMAQALGDAAPVDKHQAGQRLGAYELIEEIGRGGMGAVWRARRVDGQFTQQVAIKRLHPGSASAASAALLVERFLRERQALAGLKHPHIAALLDGGVDADGLPWFALELIEGMPITEFAQTRELPISDRVRLLLQALEAVQFAHQHLIVHRDLKPDNLLVTAAGELKLLDFGIAKLLDGVDADARTQTGARVFTPNYAAPEQVEGGDISVATDVYALGVVLFELLVGRRPFVNTGGMQLPQVSLNWRVDAPSKVLAQRQPRAARGLRGDLDIIVLRCLAREAQRRYPTVQALADDLRRYLDGRPIQARPDSAWYRGSKFVRRHALGVGAAALGLCVLLGMTVFSLRQAERAALEALRAQEFAASAERERDLANAEGRRQELLREHYANVLNRALADGAPVEPAALLDLIGQVDLSAASTDPGARRSIQLGLAELFLVRNDFDRAIALLEPMAGERAQLSASEQADYAETLATSYLRTGKPERVDAVLREGEAAAANLGERGPAAQAQLLILRAQWLRGSGEIEAAYTAVQQAVVLARESTTMSPLNHGQLLINAAQSAMAANRFAAAESLAVEGLKRWADAGLTGLIGYRVGQTLLANLQLLRGQPRAALAAYEQIAAQPDVSENVPPAAARRSSQARALSLMARHPEAIAMAQTASRQFCGAVGSATPDCLRMRLMVVDVAIAAGESTLGQDELDRVGAIAGDAPPAAILSSLPVYAALLRLLTGPRTETIRAADQALLAMSASGPNGPRNALRLRLGAAERLLDADHEDLAQALMATTLANAAPADATESGMDAALLALWRGRRDSAAADHAAAWRALEEQLGPTHPSVLRWQPQVAP
ncbi:MAG TPA: serine/threonine-protein kinase [Xanthomonadales bacterium]|nr:serine/threonine-protein kinase [Xanthomonadales bacterium]